MLFHDMPDDFEPFVRAFQATGQPESDATILAFLITSEISSVEEIVRNSGLSRAKVYSTLNRLRKLGFVIQTNERPARYQVSEELIDRIRTEMQGLFRFISKRVDEVKIPETKEILGNIKEILEKKGFTIERPRLMKLSSDSQDSREYAVSLDFLANREFSIGILLLDENRLKSLDIDLSDRFYSFIYYKLIDTITAANKQFELLESYLIFHVEPPKLTSVKRAIKRMREEYSYIIDNARFKEFYTHDKNFKILLTKEIENLTMQRRIADNLSEDLRRKLEQIDDEIALANVHYAMIADYVKMPEQWTKEKNRPQDKVIECLQNIADREKRNLVSYQRKFMSLAINLYDLVDKIDRKIYLPEASELEEGINDLDSLDLKFKAIEFELRKLRRALRSFMQKMDDINPFIFTEPYDLENEVINEKEMKASAIEFSNSIAKGLPSYIQFITGDPGSGKTKILRHVFARTLDSRRIGNVYINCPVRLDLIAGISEEFLQESNFPKNMRNMVKSIRKDNPETALDFLYILEDICDAYMGIGYKGFTLILDELENSLPHAESEDSSFRPLAMRQLSDLLKSRTSKNLGFVIACRESMYSQVERHLGLANINYFSHPVRSLNSIEIERLIHTRYKIWKINNPPEFEKRIITQILKKTNNNTRDTIKYLRELYDIARTEKKKRISVIDLKRIGEIPLFKE